MTVLFSDSIEKIEGSLHYERASQPDYNKLKNRSLKKLRKANYKHRLFLFNNTPASFYKKLAEVTALYPSERIDINIGGLHHFEGKGSQRRIRNLLIFMATLDEDWLFLSDIILERIVARYFNRKKENLGKIGLETQQLLKVFGRREVRMRYLAEVYSDRQLKSLISNGQKEFELLYIRFFDAKPVDYPKRKRGYNDHGSHKLAHERHGEDIIDNKGDDGMSNKASVQDILLEIYKKSTENYLEWLESKTTISENSGNKSNNLPAKEDIENEQNSRIKD